ncbi:hypothetical protein ACNQVK_11535 [Mycobacterium sp. 134]|uniref:hypothetical protein n=1 Tax=Mycobacterium sp. 134 TaxID=3400425 RepID=UPI003AAC1497
MKTFLVAALAATAVSFMAGCTASPESPKAVSAPQPVMSKTEIAAAGVKTSMQRKFDGDAELSRLKLTVADVTLVNKAGNEYKGIATIRTSNGATHDVPIDVTADGDNLIWDAAPGAFLFALQDPPSPPVATAPSTVPAAVPTPSAGPAALSQASDGRVYVITKSGKTRCRISTFEVACQSPFIGAPLVNGQPANGMIFNASGVVTYVVGDLGGPPATTMGYRTYQVFGWTIDATSNGTTFTHNGTGRYVFVSVTSVQTG